MHKSVVYKGFVNMFYIFSKNGVFKRILRTFAKFADNVIVYMKYLNNKNFFF